MAIYVGLLVAIRSKDVRKIHDEVDAAKKYYDNSQDSTELFFDALLDENVTTNDLKVFLSVLVTRVHFAIDKLFSTENVSNFSFLHILSSYANRAAFIPVFIDALNAKNIDIQKMLELQGSSGDTALNTAIGCKNFAGANALIAAGAEHTFNSRLPESLCIAFRRVGLVSLSMEAKSNVINIETKPKAIFRFTATVACTIAVIFCAVKAIRSESSKSFVSDLMERGKEAIANFRS